MIGEDDKVGDLTSAAALQLPHLGNLIRARLTLAQNIKDAEDAEDVDGIQPIYLVDSNVLYLYFDPSENDRIIQLFPAAKKSGSVGKDTAIITGQHLFSGRLPGQGLRPLFIDPGHLEEFRNKLSANMESFKKSAKVARETDPKDFKRALAVLRGKLTRAQHDRAALRRFTEMNIPKFLADYDLTAATAAQQLISLTAKDYIRPFRLAPYVDRLQIDKPDPEEVERWTRALSKAEPGLGAYVAKQRSQNRQRDAECLARIQMQNARLHDRGHPVRFRLVTADENIHVAVANEAQNSPDCRVQVRRASQYGPVFNTADLDNCVNRSAATIKLRDAIDTFLEEAKRPGENRDQMLERLDDQTRLLQRIVGDLNSWVALAPDGNRQDRERRAKALWKFLQERNEGVFGELRPLMGAELSSMLPKIENHWHGLLQNSVHMNTHLIVRHFHALLSDIEEAYERLRTTEIASDVALSYEREHLRHSSQLTKSHLQTLLRKALIAALGEMNRRASLSFSARAPAILTANGEHLPTRIVRDAYYKEVDELQAHIIELCNLEMNAETGEEISFRDVQLGCAAVALHLGAWSSTVNICQRLIHELKELRTSATDQISFADAHFMRASGLRALVWVQGQEIAVSEDGQTRIDEMLDSGLAHLDAAAEIYADYQDEVGVAQVHAARAMHAVTQLMLMLLTSWRPDGRQDREEPRISAQPVEIAAFVLNSSLSAIDACSRIDPDERLDLAERQFESSLRSKAAIAALLCLIAIRGLGSDMPSLDSVQFDRLRSYVEDTIQKEKKGQLRFVVWSTILDLARTIEMAPNVGNLEAITSRLDDLVAKEKDLRVSDNLEIAFLLRATKTGLADAGFETM